MASELLRPTVTNRALPPSIQAVASGISSAASLQPTESIDQILESFTSIQKKQPGVDELVTLLGETTVQAAGHADHPLKYFQEYGTRTEHDDNGIVSMAEVLSSLRKQELHFHQGVDAFLKSGIQEALASLKISPNPNIPRPLSPAALDNLISPERLKNPDRTKLQSSLQIINEMFSTLKRMQRDISDLRVGMLRSIRA